MLAWILAPCAISLVFVVYGLAAWFQDLLDRIEASK